jgi:hypothetical protein
MKNNISNCGKQVIALCLSGEALTLTVAVPALLSLCVSGIYRELFPSNASVMCGFWISYLTLLDIHQAELQLIITLSILLYYSAHTAS